MNIEFEKINLLLDVAYKNKVRLIKTKTLNEAGINNYDIKKLVEAEILKKQSHGVYKIIYKTLYFYAKDLRRSEMLDEALQCFSKIGKVYEMNSLNYQILKIYILKDDYKRAANLISKMYYKDFANNPKYGHTLLYAYLTNVIFSVSVNIKELKNKLIDWNKGNPTDLKLIVDACINNNFAQAQEYLRNLNNSEISRSKLEILEKLIDNCKRKTQSKTDKLIYFCKTEKYEEAKNYILELKKTNENIQLYDVFYNTITTYFNLINNQIISDNKYSFLMAIESKIENNFDEVLKMLSIKNTTKISKAAEYELKRLLKRNIKLAKDLKNRDFEEYSLIEKDNNITKKSDEYIIARVNKIKNINGIIILDSIENDNMKALIEFCLKDPSINVFSYGDGINKRIALINCERNLNPLQVDNLFRMFQIKFNNGNYFDALEIGKTLLKNGDNLSLIISNLGMCYFKLEFYEKAIEYFNLAINFSDNKEDIESLREYINAASSKIHNKFCYETTSQSVISEAQFYGINCLDEILNFQIKYNTNLEIACLQFGLDVYQINIVKLLLAKKYYRDNLNDLGYEYYYSVLTSKFKNSLLNLMLNDFNDRFLNYKNYAFISRSFKK